MRLLWVDLNHFRNLKRQRVELHPRFNLLLGPNGQGKTNFLEAVGYLGTLRSFRSAGRNEMIRRGESACRVSGEISSREVDKNIAFTLNSKERSQFVDGQKVSSPERYLQTVSTVHFIPEDVGLVSGSPSWRRKVIDRSVFETVPVYVSEYRRYLAALRQRNALLRRGSPSRDETAGWNRTLVETGTVIVRRRWDFIMAANEKMQGMGARIGLGRGLHLRYFPSFALTAEEDPDNAAGQHVDLQVMGNAERREIGERFQQGLSRNSGREIRAGHTLVGPHRDRIEFFLGEPESAVDLARFGSQGQKRSAVLAFKLSLGAVLSDVLGEWPVMILDDVASELDDQKRKALGDLVRGTKAQFFISTTGQEYLFLPAGEGKIWNVNDGMLEPFS
jgi:DNA replication and repair protein RecF